MGQQLSSPSISLTLCKQRDTRTINSGSYCCVGQNAEETTPGTPGTYRKRTSSQQSTTTSSSVPQNPPYSRKTKGLTDVEAGKLHSESSGDDNYGATPYLETAPFMGKATMVKPLLPEENNGKKAENEILQEQLTMQECQSIAREENTGAVESSSKTRDELDDISFVGDKDMRPKQYSVKPKSSASPLKPIPKSLKTQKPDDANDKEISRQELQKLHTDAKAILNPQEINTVNNTSEEIPLREVDNSSHVQPSSSQQMTNAPSMHNEADVAAHSSSHFHDRSSNQTNQRPPLKRQQNVDIEDESEAPKGQKQEQNVVDERDSSQSSCFPCKKSRKVNSTKGQSEGNGNDQAGNGIEQAPDDNASPQQALQQAQESKVKFTTTSTTPFKSERSIKQKTCIRDDKRPITPLDKTKEEAPKSKGKTGKKGKHGKNKKQRESVKQEEHKKQMEQEELGKPKEQETEQKSEEQKEPGTKDKQDKQCEPEGHPKPEKQQALWKQNEPNVDIDKTHDEPDDISLSGDKDVRPKQFCMKPKSSASPLKPIRKSSKPKKPYDTTNDKDNFRQELQDLQTDGKAILNPQEINTVNNTSEEIPLRQMGNSSHVPSSSEQMTNAPSIHNGADVSAHSSSHLDGRSSNQTNQRPPVKKQQNEGIEDKSGAKENTNNDKKVLSLPYIILRDTSPHAARK